MVDPKKTDSRWLDTEALEREFDAALAKYAAVEPRTGIEERILANLRAEQTKAPDRNWWRWSVAVGLAAAVVVVAVALTWKSVHPSGPVIANHPATTTPVIQEAATQILPQVGNPAPAQVHRMAASATARRSYPLLVATVPKLDVFPSPRPLSEEELALAQYVRNFPSDANQVAREQEASEREVLAKMQELANKSGESN